MGKAHSNSIHQVGLPSTYLCDLRLTVIWAAILLTANVLGLLTSEWLGAGSGAQPRGQSATRRMKLHDRIGRDEVMRNQLSAAIPTRSDFEPMGTKSFHGKDAI